LAERDLSLAAIFKQVKAEATAKGWEKPPSESTIRRLYKKHKGQGTEERREYRPFVWPEEMGEPTFPWEASAEVLEMLRYLDRKGDDRPSRRVVKWYWRVCKATPNLEHLEDDSSWPGDVAKAEKQLGGGPTERISQDHKAILSRMEAINEAFRKTPPHAVMDVFKLRYRVAVLLANRELLHALTKEKGYADQPEVWVLSHKVPSSFDPRPLGSRSLGPALPRRFGEWLADRPPFPEHPAGYEQRSEIPSVELALMELTAIRSVMQLRSFAKGIGDGAEALNREESMQELRVSGRRYHAEQRRRRKQVKQAEKGEET
jgi:hypothetical protein